MPSEALVLDQTLQLLDQTLQAPVLLLAQGFSRKLVSKPALGDVCCGSAGQVQAAVCQVMV